MTNNELYDVFLEVVRQRRSVRYLKPDPIPDEYITIIIEAAHWYSSASSPKTQRLIQNVIGYPDGLTIYDMMCVGYPARPPIPKMVRPLAEMVHYDDCGSADFRTIEQVESYARETYAWCLSAH